MNKLIVKEQKESSTGKEDEMINFDKNSHTYTTAEGKNLISVTQLLQLYRLSPDYSRVDEATLKKSAERGTLIHKEIEDYNKRGEIGFTKELTSYIGYLSDHGMKCIDSEFIVWDDIVAGTADLLLDENGEKVIADIKTTSSLHKDSVSWQLSLYAYLWEQDHPNDGEIKRGQGFWFDKEGNLEVVDIPLKPKEEVERLLESAKALNSLFAIDDTKDADSMDDTKAPVKEIREAPKSQPMPNVDDALLTESKDLRINLDNVAKYLKKSVGELTDEDIRKCIDQKKKVLEARKAR